jgi:hypothetical protein
VVDLATKQQASKSVSLYPSRRGISSQFKVYLPDLPDLPAMHGG